MPKIHQSLFIRQNIRTHWISALNLSGSEEGKEGELGTIKAAGGFRPDLQSLQAIFF